MKSNKDLWKEITIKDWNEFDIFVGSLQHREWLFRGQSNSEWSLKTSLYRLFEDMEPIITSHFDKSRPFAKDEHEDFLINKFKTNAHLYRNNLPDKEEKLEWLSIMQHFGAPTRLLDVTLSPLIASYFALEQGHTDCCIYAFNHIELSTIDKIIFEDKILKESIFENQKGENSFITPFEPKITNERLVAQQGLFLAPSNNYETFNELLGQYSMGGDVCIKIIIPKELRFKGVERLRRMNITSATLFPGIEGFCKALRFQVLESVKSQGLIRH
jgi:hypothetical protein